MFAVFGYNKENNDGNKNLFTLNWDKSSTHVDHIVLGYLELILFDCLEW